MLKKSVFLLLLVVSAFISCKKSNTPAPVATTKISSTLTAGNALWYIGGADVTYYDVNNKVLKTIDNNPIGNLFHFNSTTADYVQTVSMPTTYTVTVGYTLTVENGVNYLILGDSPTIGKYKILSVSDTIIATSTTDVPSLQYDEGNKIIIADHAVSLMNFIKYTGN